jgi:hypothetical protein
VFGNAEAEIASRGEVALPQLVFLDFEATFQNLLRFGTTDGNMDSDLFITADTKSSNRVSGLA